jgi:hypothetical protein
MPRKELVNKIAISDRMVRKCIAEEIPEIGESGSGYYFKRTTADCIAHENHIKSRLKKLAERYKRCVEYRHDIQHGRSASDVVKSWTVYQDENLRIRKAV